MKQQKISLIIAVIIALIIIYVLFQDKISNLFSGSGSSATTTPQQNLAGLGAWAASTGQTQSNNLVNVMPDNSIVNNSSPYNIYSPNFGNAYDDENLGVFYSGLNNPYDRMAKSYKKLMRV